jgi:TPR repeat protein
MYNQAAKDGSIRALNGLGYIYFFGHGDDIPMNKVSLLSGHSFPPQAHVPLAHSRQTKAFHYFLTATEYDGDTHSWFNAGYCLEHGVGASSPSCPHQ